MHPIRIGLVGDFSAAIIAHRAIDESMRLARARHDIDARWLAHRFFIGTLFQPERSALHGVLHPLVGAFMAAAAEAEAPRQVDRDNGPIRVG